MFERKVMVVLVTLAVASASAIAFFLAGCQPVSSCPAPVGSANVSAGAASKLVESGKGKVDKITATTAEVPTKELSASASLDLAGAMAELATTKDSLSAAAKADAAKDKLLAAKDKKISQLQASQYRSLLFWAAVAVAAGIAMMLWGGPVLGKYGGAVITFGAVAWSIVRFVMKWEDWITIAVLAAAGIGIVIWLLRRRANDNAALASSEAAASKGLEQVVTFVEKGVKNVISETQKRILFGDDVDPVSDMAALNASKFQDGQTKAAVAAIRGKEVTPPEGGEVKSEK